MILLLALACHVPDAPPADASSDTACFTLSPPPPRNPALQCVTWWPCDGATAAYAASFDTCEGGWTVYYGPRGAVIAGLEGEDTQTCREDYNYQWYGNPVRDCPGGAATRSPGCALPAGPDRPPVTITAGRPLPPELATWTATAPCHGVMTCPVPDRADVTLTYTYERCGFGQYGVWSADGAPLGGSTGSLGFATIALPGADEPLRAAVAACMEAPAFAATAACAAP
jgi:hypothetical protein